MADSPALTDVRDLLRMIELYQKAVNALWVAQNPEDSAELVPDAVVMSEDEAQEQLADSGSALRSSAFRVNRRIERGEIT